MPLYPLNNPYHLASIPTIKASAMLGARDLAYVRTLVPNLTGETDKLLSLLFHSFVLSLQQYEQSNGPIEPAFYVDHPTYALVESLLQRRTPGCVDGEEAGRDERRGADGVRQEDGHDAGLGSVTKEGNDEVRTEGTQATRTGEGEESSEPSKQPARRSVDLLNFLDDLNGVSD